MPDHKDVRHNTPHEGLERPPHRLADSDELLDEMANESFPASDPPSFTPSKSGMPSRKPDLPSTGTPSDAPGG